MNTPTSPLVSILIVTWNRRRDLSRSIESALGQSYPNIEVVVVDNASTDGTAEMVALDFPQVHLVRSATNLGCPSGRNLGFAHCRGTYIYMLDDDGWLKKDAIELAVRRAETDDAIGVVMSRIYEFEDGRIIRHRPVNLDQSVYLAGFSGGCSLIRRSALKAAGYFPEDFFRQAEESDLALRMLDAGYFCLLEPASVMYHAPSPVGRDSKAFIFYSLRNTNRTGLRLWPFPWCAIRPLVNLFHSFRFMIRMRYFTLPAEILSHLIRDLRKLPGQRKPVTRRAYSLFRQLQKQPSFKRPS
jgi:GT2 family glycosyltransferase